MAAGDHALIWSVVVAVHSSTRLLVFAKPAGFLNIPFEGKTREGEGEGGRGRGVKFIVTEENDIVRLKGDLRRQV